MNLVLWVLHTKWISERCHESHCYFELLGIKVHSCCIKQMPAEASNRPELGTAVNPKRPCFDKLPWFVRVGLLWDGGALICRTCSPLILRVVATPVHQYWVQYSKLSYVSLLLISSVVSFIWQRLVFQIGSLAGCSFNRWGERNKGKVQTGSNFQSSCWQLKCRNTLKAILWKWCQKCRRNIHMP